MKMFLRSEADHDHTKEEDSHDTVEVVSTVEQVEVGHETAHHDHSGLDGLWEVMFGFEHVIAEVFWNTVWLGAAFAIGRLVAFRRVHKYIDDKHGVSHNKDQY
jgi:hypothetical protein